MRERKGEKKKRGREVESEEGRKERKCSISSGELDSIRNLSRPNKSCLIYFSVVSFIFSNFYFIFVLNMRKKSEKCSSFSIKTEQVFATKFC